MKSKQLPFIKMALVGFQSELEQDIQNTREKSRKCQDFTEWRRCGTWEVMHTNVEYLNWGKVEAFRYFQFLDIRYDD